jgi:hypothetical protein
VREVKIYAIFGTSVKFTLRRHSELWYVAEIGKTIFLADTTQSSQYMYRDVSPFSYSSHFEKSNSSFCKLHTGRRGVTTRKEEIITTQNGNLATTCVGGGVNLH